MKVKAYATVTIKHQIQHRHPDIVEWLDTNCNTSDERTVACALLRFIIDRFPETACCLNGELEEWED